MRQDRPNDLGLFIRGRRQELDLTQDEVGEMISAPRGYMSQIETGAKKWPRKYIPALAKALDVSEDELKQWAGRAPITSPEEMQKRTMGFAANSLAKSIESLLQISTNSRDDNNGPYMRELLAQTLISLIDIFREPIMDKTILLRSGLREPIAQLAITYPETFVSVLEVFDTVINSEAIDLA